MPVRGSTEWRHAIVDKKIINLDSSSGRHDQHVMCAWDTCERPALETYKVRERISAPGYELRVRNYAFCSERHKMYFVNSTRDCNNLPPGYRKSAL